MKAKPFLLIGRLSREIDSILNWQLRVRYGFCLVSYTQKVRFQPPQLVYIYIYIERERERERVDGCGLVGISMFESLFDGQLCTLQFAAGHLVYTDCWGCCATI